MAGLIYQPENMQKPILTKLVSAQTSCNEMLGCFFNRFSLIYHHSKQVTKWTHQDLYHPKTVDRVLMSMYNNHISVRNCSKSHRFPTHVFHPPDTKLIVVPSHAWSVGQSAPTQVNLIRSVSLPQRQKDIGACLLPAIPKNLASSFSYCNSQFYEFFAWFRCHKKWYKTGNIHLF